MDISAMLVGKSDQLDNVDLISGPRDFTITGVSGGSSEQPLNVALAEYDRPWRPGLTMRRLMAAMWNTTDASLYIGRRVRLYRDADVSFGKDKTAARGSAPPATSTRRPGSRCRRRRGSSACS